MNLLKLAAEIFVIYLLYRLIFNFIIPIYKSTSQIKKQFRDVQSRMNEEMNRQQQNTTTPTDSTPPPAPKDADYIEFEEVK